MSDSLASRTLERATRALHANPIACLPEIVKLMRALSGNSNQISVSELAEVIEKDPVILAKVIGVANTLRYNPIGAAVTSVSQAIHVIGYDRIRSLGMSLMLIEQTSRSQGVEEQRETAALALTAGCLAQSLARTRGGLEPEQAFVCASLRCFGRLVMVTCMLDEFHAAQKLAAQSSDDEAFRQVFGLTPLELGHELLKAACLPHDILSTLKDLPPDTVSVLDQQPAAQMLALCDFAARLAELTLAPGLSMEQFVAAAHRLSHAYAAKLPAIADEVPELLTAAGRQLDYFVRVFRLKSLPTQSLSRLRRRGAALDPKNLAQHAATSVAAVPAAKPPPPVPGEDTAPPLPPPAPIAAASEWPAHISRLTDLLHRPGASRDDVFTAVIDAVRQGMNSSTCLLFSAAPGGQHFALRHGYGPPFEALRHRVSLEPNQRTIFSVCLTRRENILIHRSEDPKLQPYLPEWLRLQPGLGAYALLPLSDGRTAHGLVLAAWAEARQIVLSADQVRHIRSLLTLASLSCSRLAEEPPDATAAARQVPDAVAGEVLVALRAQ